MSDGKQAHIRQEADQLNSERDALKNQIEILLVRKRQLQNSCDHPNKHQYSAQGELGWHCPDCDWMT